MHVALINGRRLIALSILLLASAFAQDAPEVTVPHEFAAGEVIRASEMNENFEALLEAVRALEAPADTDPEEAYVAIPPQAFAPGSEAAVYQTFDRACLDAGAGSMYAPVHLPHGAEVFEVTFTYEDASSADLTMRFNEYRPENASYQGIVEHASAGSTGVTAVGSPAGLSHVVDNRSYSYYVQVYSSNWACNELNLRQVTIGYLLR